MAEPNCSGGVCVLPKKEDESKAVEEAESGVAGLGVSGKKVSPLERLLGPKIMGKDGEVETTSLEDKEVVGLYFSAHWCPPCRGFTPVFAKKYEELKKKGKSLEVVFVSSDKEQSAFDDYYKDMPWLALPYNKRRAKNNLSRKFKVEGIPSLILLDPKTGEVTNAEGTQAIRQNKEYPWKGAPKESNLDILKAATYIDKEGKDFKFEAFKSKYIILYFSAHWCPPCRGFTPDFAQWYKDNFDKLKGKDNSFDVVFCSSDRDQSSFDGYYKEHPWKALKYSDRQSKEKLSNNCGVQGIPTVAVLNAATGEIVTTEGRGGVTSDKEAKNFPWKPELVNDLNERPNDINDRVCMVFCLEKLEKADQDAKIAMIKELAESHKAKMGGDPEFGFLYITKKGDIGARLRGAIGQEDVDKDDSTMIIINFGGQQKHKWTSDLEKDSLIQLLRNMEDDYETKIKWTSLKE